MGAIAARPASPRWAHAVHRPRPRHGRKGRPVHAAAVGPPVVRQSSVPAGPRAPLLGGARCFGTDRQPAAAEGQGRQATRLGPGAPPSLRRVAQRGRGAVDTCLTQRSELVGRSTRARRWPPPKTEIGTPKKTLKLEVRFGFGPPANASTSEPSRNQTAGAWRPPRATRPPLLTCLGRPRSRAAAGLEVSSTLLVA